MCMQRSVKHRQIGLALYHKPKVIEARASGRTLVSQISVKLLFNQIHFFINQSDFQFFNLLFYFIPETWADK